MILLYKSCQKKIRLPSTNNNNALVLSQKERFWFSFKENIPLATQPILLQYSTLSGIRLEVEKKTVEKILDCLEVDWELIRRFREVSAVRR